MSELFFCCTCILTWHTCVPFDCAGSKLASVSGCGGAGGQVSGVKSNVRVGNAASNSVESSGGAHDGAGTSGIAPTATAGPPVSASSTANPSHLHLTHKHLLRSRVKLNTAEQQTKEVLSTAKTHAKSSKKDVTSASCCTSRYITLFCP